MAIISKVTNGANIISAAYYGLGKNRQLKNDTENWLLTNNLKRPDSLANYRAVAVGATHEVDPLNPVKLTDLNRMYRQSNQRNQCFRIVQSFSASELDSKTPTNWQKANQVGIEFSKRMFPDNQAVVYTHIDAKTHHLHNHIIVNKVLMSSGYKLSYGPSGPLKEIRQTNDQICREFGLQIVPPVPKYLPKQSEQDLIKKGNYSWKDYLRCTVHYAQLHTTNWDNYEQALANRGISINLRGKDVLNHQKITYSLINQSSQKLVRCRAKNLSKYEAATKENISEILGYNTDDLALLVIDAKRDTSKNNEFIPQFSNSTYPQQTIALPPNHTPAELKRIKKAHKKSALIKAPHKQINKNISKEELAIRKETPDRSKQQALRDYNYYQSLQDDDLEL